MEVNGLIRQRRSRFPRFIRSQVAHLARAGYGATDISRELHRSRSVQKRDIPSTRTIRKWIKEELVRGPIEPWQLIEVDPDDAPLVLPALAALLQHTDGRLAFLTKAEGEWIARLRRVQPSMPAWEALKVSRRYLEAGSHQPTLAELDRYVAFELWSHPERASRAVSEGLISQELIDRIDDGGQFGDPVYRMP